MEELRLFGSLLALRYSRVSPSFREVRHIDPLAVNTEALLDIKFDYWILQTIAMMVTALLIPRLRITSIFGALFTVITIAFINSKAWDAALFFQVPNDLTKQTLLLFLTNGLIFWAVVKFLPGIEVDGILPALVAPVVFTFSSIIIGEATKDVDWMKVLNWIIQTLQQLRDYFQKPSGPVLKAFLSSFVAV